MTAGGELHYENPGRSLRNGMILLAVFVALLLAWAFLDVSPIILGIISLFALPAALDFARGRRAELHLDASGLRWSSGPREGSVARHAIARVVTSLRLDFSLRVTVETTDGRRIRLPYECVPPRGPLEAALQAAGVEVVRRDFALL